MLNKRERNRIYQVIAKYEYDPAEFDLDDNGNEAVVTHSSGSTFKYSSVTETLPDEILKQFGISDTMYEFRFNVVDGTSSTGRASLANVTTLYMPDWLKEIRLTVGVPDYWEEMKLRRQLLAEIQREPGNTPFTQDEQKQIAAQLQEITKQLKEQFELTNEQIERIEEWRDDAAEASTRMGRKDWLIYFLGSITALIITATVTGGVGEHIFNMVIQGIAHLFTGGSEPPQIPPQILA